MIGHEFAPSETNYGHWVAVCSCGWLGPITAWRVLPDTMTVRGRKNRELTIAALVAHHAEHLREVDRDIVDRSSRVIARNAEALDRVIPTVLRPGRFGNA